jgi:hypothetical protein
VVTSYSRYSKAAGAAKLDRNPLGGKSTSLGLPAACLYRDFVSI